MEDFGGPLQFILDVGVNYRVYERFGLGYRYQHWSDAGIYGDQAQGAICRAFSITGADRKCACCQRQQAQCDRVKTGDVHSG